jgi:hypothetical protein
LNCLEEIDQCQNIDYSHRWETQTLKVLKSTTAANTPGWKCPLFVDTDSFSG